ncbi:stabilizer of axonemal microtubules 4 [Morphnus guianensis]
MNKAVAASPAAPAACSPLSPTPACPSETLFSGGLEEVAPHLGGCGPLRRSLKWGILLSGAVCGVSQLGKRSPGSGDTLCDRGPHVSLRHGYQETVSPSQGPLPWGTFHSHPCLQAGRELLWDSPTMVSACLFVCPRAKLRSLLQDSPAAGLGIVSPSVKARTGGSADLMNFYATSYAVAYGQPRFRPRLGHHTGTGYVSNNHSAISCLLCPRGAAEGHCQDTATSTTTEHFKPFWLPDGRSLLPRHVHQPESGYLQESSLSCPRTGGVSPQHTRLLQGPPRASREHGTESRHASPAQSDVLQKTTIGAKEQSGFTRATPRSDSILPVLPPQPLGVSICRRAPREATGSAGRCHAAWARR